jgi:hypothetical protein
MNTSSHKHEELAYYFSSNTPQLRDYFEGFSLDVVVDFLEASHQRFFEKSMPNIEQNFLLLIKLFSTNKQLPILFKLFLKFEFDLRQHAAIEEETAFLYAKTIFEAFQKDSLAAMTFIHYGEYSAKHFANSHENGEQYLREIIFLLGRQKDLAKHPVYNVLVYQLTEMDRELHSHAWIEDYVFVEKTIEIEQNITDKVNNLRNQ